MSAGPRITRTRSAAFAPATVANVSVGFDVLGFAVEGVGDVVRMHATEGEGLVVDEVTGVVTELPRDPAANTATVAAYAMLVDLGLERRGLRVSIDKGIPLGSGMGGSAASAVAAVVAINGLLDRPQSRERLLGWALAGEAVASGAPHADNAAPCLYGGLIAAVEHDPPRVVHLPVPDGIRCVLVHPGLRIDTRDAREVLDPTVPLGVHVEQTMRLAGFVAGCFRGDLDLIRRSLVDLVAEPRRATLIPGFDQARRAALDAGALGLGISGSGPAVFAWVPAGVDAESLARTVAAVFEGCGREVRHWVSPIDRRGARVTETG